MTPQELARAAIGLSIVDAFDALRPGERIEGTRDASSPFGGIVITTQNPGEPPRSFGAILAIDAFAKAIRGTPMTEMSRQNIEISPPVTPMSYPKSRKSKKP